MAILYCSWQHTQISHQRVEGTLETKILRITQSIMLVNKQN